MRDVAMLYVEERRPRSQGYFDALEGLIRVMGGLQGRKVVLALSHGVAADPTAEIAEAMRAVVGNTDQVANMIQYLGFSEGSRLEMDRVIDLALREGVTFHFVDRNPVPTWDSGASQMEAHRPAARPYQAAHVAAQMDLEELAVNTGGSFVADTDVFEGMSYAMDLEVGAYLVGYYTDRFLTAKQMRKISITTSRKGVRLSHRRGSYDQPSVSDVVGAVRLGSISAAKEDASEKQQQPSRNSFVPFQIVADPRGIGYETVGKGVHASFTLHVQVLDAKGRIVADGFRFLNHAYPLDVWESGEVEPVVINGWAELPPGRYSLNALIRNPVNGRKGELVQVIDVPRPSPAPVSAQPDDAPTQPPQTGG